VLCSLWEGQCLEGKNPYPRPRGPLVQAFMEDLKIECYSQQHAAFEDRGAFDDAPQRDNKISGAT